MLVEVRHDDEKYDTKEGERGFPRAETPLPPALSQTKRTQPTPHPGATCCRFQRVS